MPPGSPPRRGKFYREQEWADTDPETGAPSLEPHIPSREVLQNNSAHRRWILRICRRLMDRVEQQGELLGVMLSEEEKRRVYRLHAILQDAEEAHQTIDALGQRLDDFREGSA